MQLAHLQKIAVFRALQLGDMLCAIPAFRALRQAYPGAHMALVGLPWAQTLADRFPRYVDELIVFPGYPGLPEQQPDLPRIPGFLSYMQQRQFDLVLQLQGNGSVVNPLVTLWNGRYTAGFYRDADYCPGKLFLNYPDTVHEIQRHLLLLQHLGITATDTRLEFPLYEQDARALQSLQLPVLPQQYVCIHPGSRDAARQWPPELFALLGNRCAAAGLQVVLTGTANEAPLTAAVKAAMTYPAIDTAGLTGLGAMGMLLKNAFALVANCTGVSH
ncbi:MAG TPA: glycosyltransferase family 9 protein, partial [Chitinophaga sp.]